jgi:hypothetical protein
VVDGKRIRVDISRQMVHPCSTTMKSKDFKLDILGRLKPQLLTIPTE